MYGVISNLPRTCNADNCLVSWIENSMCVNLLAVIMSAWFGNNNGRQDEHFSIHCLTLGSIALFFPNTPADRNSKCTLYL